MQPHSYGEAPEQIIWMQIPGLQLEHLALLKFSPQKLASKNAFSKHKCLGATWSFNLYKMRPNPLSNFFSQLTGKPNIKNVCDGYNKKPFWSYLKKAGYVSGMVERGLTQNSMVQANCSKQSMDGFFGETTRWVMGKAPQSTNKLQLFHHLKPQPFKKGWTYFDRSCQTGRCQSSLLDNVAETYKQLTSGGDYSLFIIRDTSYMEALKRRNIKSAIEILGELASIYDKFYQLAKKSKNMMLVVTSAYSKPIEFPKSGKSWYQFDKSGANIVFKKSALLSPIIVYGAKSENMCGLMNDAEVFTRMLAPADYDEWSQLSNNPGS